MSSEWQPIETAPRDGTYVLATRDDGRTGVVQVKWCTFVSFDNQQWGQWGSWPAHDEWVGLTHWMPLPKPPVPA